MTSFLKKYGLFILAGVIFIIGLIHALNVFMNNSVFKDSQTIAIPRDLVTLAPGNYTIFHEYSEYKQLDGSVQISWSNAMKGIANLVELTVQNTATGEHIKVVANSSMNYQVNERKGESLYNFKAAEESQYELKTVIEDALAEEAIHFVLVPNFMGGITTIFKILGVYLFMSAAAVGMGIFLLIRSWKKRMS